ncbi:MAG: MarR family transcriptional regulator [Candidatus Limnocylindrales bacterium]
MARTIDAIRIDDATKDRIIADFRGAMAELRCIGSEKLVRLGVSMTQLHVMSMLDRHGDMPMSRMAEMIDISLSNATGLIDRMEERGYVDRVRVPDDRRVVLVRLSDTGRKLLDEIEVLRTEMLRTVLDRMDPDQLDGLARATADLRGALVAVATSPGATDHDHTTDRWRA